MKMRDLKMASVLLNQPKQFEQNEGPRGLRASRGPKSKKASVQPGEQTLQASQPSCQNHGEQAKSAVSTRGNGSENVSSVCTAEGNGPQFLRQVQTNQMQNVPLRDITKRVAVKECVNHGPCPLLVDSYLASTQAMVALSNCDLNSLGEFACDNTQAASFGPTASTIQTEAQRLPPNHGPGLEQPNKLGRRFPRHHHAAKNVSILEGLGLNHHSNYCSSSSDSRYSADCKSRDSCVRPEIQINDSSEFKRGELHQANMNLLVHH